MKCLNLDYLVQLPRCVTLHGEIIRLYFFLKHWDSFNSVFRLPFCNTLFSDIFFQDLKIFLKFDAKSIVVFDLIQRPCVLHVCMVVMMQWLHCVRRWKTG